MLSYLLLHLQGF